MAHCVADIVLSLQKASFMATLQGVLCEDLCFAEEETEAQDVKQPAQAHRWPSQDPHAGS